MPGTKSWTSTGTIDLMENRFLKITWCLFVLFVIGCVRGGERTPSVPATLPSVDVTHRAKDAGELWVETMVCGSTRYRIESKCTASGSDMELNECSSQRLVVMQGGTKRMVQLPSPLPSNSEALRLEKLFVVQWGCVTTAEGAYAVLYYSQGGGSAEASESVEFYDGTGNPVGAANPDWVEINRKWSDDLRPVKSIMPLEGGG